MATARISAKSPVESEDEATFAEIESLRLPRDGSGWSPHPSERRDFMNRIRAFPPSVALWRKRLLDRLRSGKPGLPLSGKAPAAELGERLDDGITYLREIARILAVLYGTPNLGNKTDPVDELVYIILSRKTPEKAYQKTFESLKNRFSSWDDLLRASPRTVEKLVRPGGLPGKKTASLFGALRALRKEFGSCTLEPARTWSDAQLEHFLCGLPEIQRKSAYCIMMYSFGREVFPADTHVGRVLARLGPYREIGLDLEGMDHKQLQRVLSDLIPPPLRYSLHVNLVQHGRLICRAPKPLCDQCELKKFCHYYRTRESARVMASDQPTVIDLFCGAGGSSEGFYHAGFKVLASLDFEPAAIRTYRLNHPGVPEDRVLCKDIRALPKGMLRKLAGGKDRLDVLVGSPPCQGFSSAGFRSKKTHTGYRAEDDERNHLWEWMVSAALDLRPKLFLMENVPGMQSTRREDTSFLEAVAKRLEEQGGYRTEVWRLNAAAFGVPQERNRYFLVASRLQLMPARPPQEYQDLRRSDLECDALPPIGLGEAIFDLPPREAGAGVAIELAQHKAGDDNRARRYLKKFGIQSDSPILFQHTVRYHNSNDLELYALLRPGEDSVHFLEKHKRTDLMRYRKDVFDDKYARLRSDRPCKTIVAHLAKDGNGYIHPTQIRSLSFREAARVQSFHDGFVFCGSPSDQWVQLGNAVPPVLAAAIARSFRNTLSRS
jgi:DNA (cytosine-5)-methyltransferase 1